MLICYAMQGLRIFCDVANHRSFSLAAAQHGITQSAASQRVGQLEKKLGVKLIDRSVRPLTLTEAGAEFLRGCQELLERYDRLEQRVSRYKTQAEGVVRVDAIYSAGIDLLNHVKESFESLHPGVRVVIEYKHPDEVYEAVCERRCDLGILSYPERLQQVQTIPLRDEPMAVVCSPRHPVASLGRVQASHLQAWSMVAFEHTLPVARHIRRYLRDHGVQPEVVNMFDNIDTIKSAVAVTDQIAILPKRTVSRELAAGTLAAVELGPRLVRPMGVIYRGKSGQGFGPAVQAFIDYLLKHAGPEGDDGVDQTEVEPNRQLVGSRG